LEIQSLVIKELSTSATSHAITALAMHVARSEVAKSASARLTLCYVLPDEHGVQPFEGMRLSSYDPTSGVLTVEACVPAHLVHHASRAGQYVLAVVADAIDAAREFFREQGVTAFDAEGLQSWLRTVRLADLAPPRFQQVRNTDFDWG